MHTLNTNSHSFAARWCAPVLAFLLVIARQAAAAPLDPNAFSSLGSLNVASGTITINTDSRYISGAANFAGTLRSQPGGPEVVVFNFDNVNISSGVTINLTGSRPLAILSKGDILIQPALTLNGGAMNPTQGFQGGIGVLGGGRGGTGGYSGSNIQSAGEFGSGPGGGEGGAKDGGRPLGGGGGGFGGHGGNATNALGVSGGNAYGDLWNTQFAGSGGGGGGEDNTDWGGGGGAGGGGIQIAALGTVTLSTVSANGGAGFRGYSSSYGAGGGGSGGGIIVSGSTISYTSLLANGGSAGTNGSGGGGGGQIVVDGLASYSVGTLLPGVNVASGVAFSNSFTDFGSAGTITVHPQTVVVPNARSLVLNGEPVVPVSPVEFGTPTVRVLADRNVTINSGGLATFAASNAIRTDSALVVDGELNLNGHSQAVGELDGSHIDGAVVLPENSALQLAGGMASTFAGRFVGAGTLHVGASHELTVDHNSALATLSGNLVLDGKLEFNKSNYSSIVSPLMGTGILTTAGVDTALYVNNATGFAGTLEVTSGGLVLTASAPNAHTKVGAEGAFTIYQSVAVKSLENEGIVTIYGSETLTLGGSEANSSSLGEITGSGNLAKTGAGTLIFEGTQNYTGTTNVLQGTLDVKTEMFSGAAVKVAGAGTLQAGADIWRAVQGAVGSTIIADGDVVMGDFGSFSGFQTAGSLEVGVRNIVLGSRGLALLNGETTLDGGSITASRGVAIGTGAVLSGHGAVSGKIAAGFGSIIDATGPLDIGNGNDVVGFHSDGELYVNDQSVWIYDKNEAVLGSITALGNGFDGGTLIAGQSNANDTHNHFLLEAGKNLIGRGAVEGNFKNQGHVLGDGASLNERVVFGADWTVSGKGSFENTLVLGTFAPGDSPAIVQGTNQAFGGVVEIELGGLTPGFGPDNHDQINDLGEVLLLPGTTLSILPWNGFVPNLGDEFVIMTWADGLDGLFSNVLVGNTFADQGIQFQLTYTNVSGPGYLMLTAVPEPSGFGLALVAALFFMLTCRTKIGS